ncbi:early nodulin-like protein 5 [Arachis stenosperma]|uniref:early nodulin-like protein 5 n=1 Tax=Arachis stenosperma TaxID=217475 RepID=UPI0025AD6545|nr:early nodulin-like protein 5 [Arachis stenosperma]
MYNQWASQNRFKVDDTLRFKYSKDSVLVVSEEEYESCRSTKPLFFSNNGDTVFKFEHPGVYYFISGVRGHCDKGQKMIVKVLAVHNPKPEPPHSHSPAPAFTPASTPASTPAPSPSHHSNAGRPIPLLSITNLPLFLILLLPMLFA